MEYIVYCKSDEYDFMENVDSLDDDCIKETLSELFSDEINDALGSLKAKPCGFFPNLCELSDYLYNAAHEYISGRMTEIAVYIQESDESGRVVNKQRIDLAKILGQIIEDRRDCEQSFIDEGQAVLFCLEEFLAQGVWQFGLQKNGEFVNTNPLTWPKPIVDSDSIIWQDGTCKLSPIIWFGLRGDKPIDCWVISKKPRMFEVLDYDRPYNVERWKSFWFNHFWTFDWNILFDGKGDSHITWMFAECGMDEPPIDGALTSCPILLAEDDTIDTLSKKIDDFFVKQMNIGD